MSTRVERRRASPCAGRRRRAAARRPMSGRTGRSSEDNGRRGGRRGLAAAREAGQRRAAGAARPHPRIQLRRHRDRRGRRLGDLRGRRHGGCCRRRPGDLRRFVRHGHCRRRWPRPSGFSGRSSCGFMGTQCMAVARVMSASGRNTDNFKSTAFMPTSPGKPALSHDQTVPHALSRLCRQYSGRGQPKCAR